MACRCDDRAKGRGDHFGAELSHAGMSGFFIMKDYTVIIFEALFMPGFVVTFLDKVSFDQHSSGALE